MKNSLDSIGGVGSVISAVSAAAPCCLPFLASVAGAVGLNSLLPYSGYIIYYVQAFAVIAAVGAFLSFRKHHRAIPLTLTIISVLALIYAYNVSLVAWLLYAGLGGLVVAATWNTIELKRCNQCRTPA
jgi:hypothetical protein